jgi:hypothetical protein
MKRLIDKIINFVRQKPLLTLLVSIVVLIIINVLLAPVILKTVFSPAGTNNVSNVVPLSEQIETKLTTPFPPDKDLQLPYQGDGFILSEIKRTSDGVPAVMEVYIASDQGRLNFLSWVQQFTMPGTALAPVINYHPYSQTSNE